MGVRDYDRFDLLIEARPDGGYVARVTSSPVGDLPHQTFTLPFTPTVLENLLLKLDPGRSGTRRVLNPRSEAAQELGGALFEAVLGGEVGIAWSRSQDAAADHGKGLRLRLLLDDAPGLAGLPWELLYDHRSGSYLAQSERSPVVRYLDVPQRLRPLKVEGPLRVLLVVSSPTDLPELDVEAEWSNVREALRDRVAEGRVVVDRLPDPTIGELGSWLRSHDVHILHFIGHGDVDRTTDEGVVYFCDQYGRATAVSGTVLGAYVHDHDPLRLVILNACQTAAPEVAEPLGGFAQRIVRQNAGAVVAMQFPITDRAAAAFSHEFYGAIADGFPVDQAATTGRKALLAGFGSEWSTPVVFMRAEDGRLFDPVAPAPAAGRASPPAPPAAGPESPPAPPPPPPPAVRPRPEAAPSRPPVSATRVLPVAAPTAARAPAAPPPPPSRPPSRPVTSSAPPRDVSGPSGRRRRPWLWVALAAVLTIAVVAGGLWVLGGPDELVIEAESGTIVPPVEVVDSDLAWGGAYVESTAANEGSLSYVLDTDEAVYYIWGRVEAASENKVTANSFIVSIDGSPGEIWDFFQEYEARGEELPSGFTWDRISLRCGSDSQLVHLCDPWMPALTAGQHTLVLDAREPGSRLDVLIVTTDPEYVPPEEET